MVTVGACGQTRQSGHPRPPHLGADGKGDHQVTILPPEVASEDLA